MTNLMGNWVGNYYVQFGVPQLRKDVEKLDKVLWGINKIIRTLDYTTYTGLMDLFILEKNSVRGDTRVAYLMEVTNMRLLNSFQRPQLVR